MQLAVDQARNAYIEARGGNPAAMTEEERQRFIADAVRAENAQLSPHEQLLNALYDELYDHDAAEPETEESDARREALVRQIAELEYRLMLPCQ